MKKALLFFGLFLLFSHQAYAQPYPPLEISADTVQTITPSGTIDVSIRAGSNWQNITTLRGTFSIDTTVITWNQMSFWGLSNPPGAIFTYQGFGLVTYTWNSLITIGPTLSQGDIVFTLRFNVVGTSGTASPVAFVNAPQGLFWMNGFGWSGNNFTASNGQVIVGSCPQVTGTDTRTECDALLWIDGNTYTSNNNTATHLLSGVSANGCDSLVTLDLTIINSASGTDTRTECVSFVWIDGNTYTANNNSATFNIQGGAANGCDSLVTLDLTFSPPATGMDSHTACDSYTWIDGNTYFSNNNSATHRIVGGAANGCDSLVVLNLTVLYATSSVDGQVACDSLTWIDGITYTASNSTASFTISGGASNGCDSVILLNLIIDNSKTGIDTRVACDSLTWIDGNTYTTSTNMVTYNVIGGAANGCDSLVTLDLTITGPSTGIETVTKCGSFTWIDGITYTSSTTTPTYNIVGGASTGCDSLVALDLTINNVSDLTTMVNGIAIMANNPNATYQWLDCNLNYEVIMGETGQTFTPTIDGNYAVRLTENGCTDTSACVAITTVGVLNSAFKDNVSIYPNPTDGLYSIQFDETQNSILLTLRNVLGKELFVENYEVVNRIDLELKYPTGTYFVEVSDEEGRSAVMKVMKR